MKLLVYSAITLAFIFITLFILLNLLGVIDFEKIRQLILDTHQSSPQLLGIVIFIIIFSDLLIAVPTLTISILAGYLLGFQMGFISVLSGMLLAGYTGYFISRRYGNLILNRVANKLQIDEMHKLFQRHGLFMLLICRASPILPEITACLSGMSRLSLSLFSLGWISNSLIYAAIATYAGSISSLNNPMPAIYTAVAISGVLSLLWYLFIRKHRTLSKETSV